MEQLLDAMQVKRKIFRNLEVASLDEVHGIVLHRTSSATAKQTLNAYQTQRSGAHFLIDTDGTTYLTASLGMQTQHVGYVRPRGEVESTLPDVDKADLARARKSGQGAYKRIHELEKQKRYPGRYPVNADSIGIEVVGAYDKKTRAFVPPTPQQENSLSKVIEALKDSYQLTNKDIYYHGIISYKDENGTEGRNLGY